MLIIFITLTGMLLLACIVKLNYGKDGYKDKDFKFGMGLACWLEQHFRLSKRLGKTLWRQMDNISRHESVDEAMERHYVKKLYYIILILIVTNVLGAMYCANNLINREDAGKISRPEPGEGSALVTKKVVIGDEEEVQNIEFEVDERKPDEEETNDVIQNAKDYIDNNFLGDNDSCESVCKKLNLVDTYEDLVDITWITDDEGYISSDGSVERIRDEDGIIVTISAVITYGDYEEEYIIPLKLVPDKDKEDVNYLLDSIAEINNKDISQQSFYLPDYIGDKSVSYVEEGNNDIGWILCLGCVAILAIFIALDQKVIDDNKYRTDQMMVDFPEVMSKMSIYLQAGLSIKGAWCNIVNETITHEDNNDERRFIYDEMYITWNEMRNGASFNDAIERFGKRCDVLQYKKFATWLIQSNSKGVHGLIELLLSESFEAKEERNKIIRINGEKISQKLLLPMMGLLVLVMMLVVIPAFISMN